MPKDHGMPLSGKATVDALADQWATILAIYMHSRNIKEIALTMEEIEALGSDASKPTITVGGSIDTVKVQLLPLEEAQSLARKSTDGFSKC